MHARLMVVLGRRIGAGPVFGPHGFQFFRGIEGIISLSGTHQLFRIFPIDFFSFALAIGSEWAAFQRTFIRFQSAPFQCFVNIFFGAGYKAALVCVFYTQDEISLVFFRKQIIV